jgi:dTDP-4-amino-4,6-dideoxygalactose transaminase
MTSKHPLAVFGAQPRFSEPLPVGQFYWPEWERYERAARDIFTRRFYTSQRFAGPLVVQFQRRLEAFLGVKHAIAIRNATNGLMIAAHTLGLRGKVAVPAWTCVATVQSLLWSSCRPAFCDIDPETQQMSAGSVRSLLEGGDISGILGVHLWGNAAPVVELDSLAEQFGVPLYYDAAHAFGCSVNGRAIGTFGRATVFSFHPTNILSTGEGGCITTNDDALASKFTAMRGDETPGTGVALQSATSRMSEIQAAIGLMMLDDFDRNRRTNEEQRRSYQARLNSIPGIKILQPHGVTVSNLQSLTAIVDQSKFGLSRDELVAVLRAEHVAAEKLFDPPNHRVGAFAEIGQEPEQLQNTELAARTTFQLPVGAAVTVGHIEQICEIVRGAHVHAETIKSVLAPLPAT